MRCARECCFPLDIQPHDTSLRRPMALMRAARGSSRKQTYWQLRDDLLNKPADQLLQLDTRNGPAVTHLKQDLGSPDAELWVSCTWRCQQTHTSADNNASLCRAHAAVYGACAALSSQAYLDSMRGALRCFQSAGGGSNSC